MILIADDNADVRRIIRNLIEEIDPEVIECPEGADAVETYDRHRPDWVLMDINMRPMDGLTAMSAIRQLDPEARVVIVSQHQDARTRESAMAMGAHAFVGKEVLMKLREVLNASIGVPRR